MIQTKRFAALTAALAPTNPNTAEHLNKAMVRGSKSKGFPATTLSTQLRVIDGRSWDGPSISGKYDATMVSTIYVGYRENSDFSPFVAARASLLNSDCSDFACFVGCHG